MLARVLLLSLVVASAHAQDAASERERCAAVQSVETIQFRGLTLVEAPDVTDPRLRLANALISSRCYEAARRALERYVTEEGRDAQALYVATRYFWIHAGSEAADEAIPSFIAEYPSFVSAKVLLSGLRIDQRRLAEAGQMLTELERDAPTDLWVVLNGVRVAAQRYPDPIATEFLLEVVTNPQFPPNAREGAGVAVWRARSHTTEQSDKVYRDMLSFESATPLGCKVENYAWWLIERQSRFEDARKMLEGYADGRGSCYAKVRMYLAYTYLLAAAQLAPGVAPSNATLVQRASEVLAGDHEALEKWLPGKPAEASVRALLDAVR